MSKTITLAEAITRFTPIITTGVEIEAVIQEAVDRIFELGRYPGTTVEIELLQSDFIASADNNEWYCEFDEALYAGAIGFRNKSRGWSILDQVSLYKDGINAGDQDFIDLGTILQGDGTEIRRYRCPRNFQPEHAPFYVLMKKESPVLADEDLIPIQSISALKIAIQAVCYENVSDENLAQSKWAEFAQFMTASEKQSSGRKKYYIGMDSSLKRKPKQFM